jgi:hypothetical protein
VKVGGYEGGNSLSHGHHLLFLVLVVIHLSTHLEICITMLKRRSKDNMKIQNKQQTTKILKSQ